MAVEDDAAKEKDVLRMRTILGCAALALAFSTATIPAQAIRISRRNQAQAVADFHAAIMAALSGVGIEVHIDESPNELPDPILSVRPGCMPRMMLNMHIASGGAPAGRSRVHGIYGRWLSSGPRVLHHPITEWYQKPEQDCIDFRAS